MSDVTEDFLDVRGQLASMNRLLGFSRLNDQAHRIARAAKRADCWQCNMEEHDRLMKMLDSMATGGATGLRKARRLR